MEQGKKIILVTWDFTEKSEIAFEHAIEAGGSLFYGIGLLHIVKKESEIEYAEHRIKTVIEEKFPQLKNPPEIIVKTGNIFSTIGETATEIGASLIFMGTHGIKGAQKFFGSWALKVISSSRVPFIVVQSKPNKNRFEKIVFPLNYRKENKEAINWASYFSKYFHSKFHFITAKHKDVTFKKGVESNILFINKYFKAKSIEYQMDDAPGQTDFMKEVVQYASDINADAIMLMTTKDIGLADYMLGAHEQYVIANESKIPVICINPRPPKIGGSFSTSGS